MNSWKTILLGIICFKNLHQLSSFCHSIFSESELQGKLLWNHWEDFINFLSLRYQKAYGDQLNSRRKLSECKTRNSERLLMDSFHICKNFLHENYCLSDWKISWELWDQLWTARMLQCNGEAGGVGGREGGREGGRTRLGQSQSDCQSVNSGMWRPSVRAWQHGGGVHQEPETVLLSCLYFLTRTLRHNPRLPGWSPRWWTHG